jgi:hypothetical protein
MRKVIYAVFVLSLAAFFVYAQNQTSMSIGSGGGGSVSATTCTNQFISAIAALTGAGTCTTATLASAQFANQGTTTTVLHGNAAGNPGWSAVNLTNDVTGNLSTGQLKTAGTGAATAVVSGFLNVNVTPVTTTDTNEDVLMTYTLPANTLSANTKGIRIRSMFLSSNNSQATVCKLYFGSTVIVQTPSTSGASVAFWVEATVLRTSANTQIAGGWALLGVNTAGQAASGSTAFESTPGEDLTAVGGILIKGAAQKAVSGTVSQMYMTIEAVN